MLLRRWLDSNKTKQNKKTVLTAWRNGSIGWLFPCKCLDPSLSPPVWVLLHVPDAPLLIWLPTDVPGRARMMIQGLRPCYPRGRHRRSTGLLASLWPTGSHCGHFGEWTSEQKPLSFCKCSMYCSVRTLKMFHRIWKCKMYCAHNQLKLFVCCPARY